MIQYIYIKIGVSSFHLFSFHLLIINLFINEYFVFYHVTTEHSTSADEGHEMQLSVSEVIK